MAVLLAFFFCRFNYIFHLCDELFNSKNLFKMEMFIFCAFQTEDATGLTFRVYANKILFNMVDIAYSRFMSDSVYHGFELLLFANPMPNFNKISSFCGTYWGRTNKHMSAAAKPKYEPKSSKGRLMACWYRRPLSINRQPMPVWVSLNDILSIIAWIDYAMPNHYYNFTDSAPWRFDYLCFSYYIKWMFWFNNIVR